MPTLPPPLKGAFLVPESVTLADIWSGLHADAISHNRIHQAPDAHRQRAAINDSSRALMRALEECPAPRWQALIECLGVTQYGAIALSWCKGARLEDVVTAFAASVSDPQDLDRRAVSFLAPAHGASERRLAKLIELANHDTGALALLCLGHPAPLIFDMDESWLSALPPPLRDVLNERAPSQAHT
ncbi:MAG: hypothetical protein AAFN94_01585 [Pseudomonadota bacterium]